MRHHLIVALGLAAGCASAANPLPRIETQSVIVSEPPAPAGPAVPEQPAAEEHAGDALLQAMTHMVSNEGTTRPLAWHWVPALRGVGCTSGYARALGDPLYEGGVYGALDPRVGLQWREGLWLGVGAGIGFGDDDGEPAVFALPCDGTVGLGLETSRIARLAPEVAGRDTSHLFTTSRAASGIGLGRSAGPADLLGTVVGSVVSHAPESAPRTAKPRPAAAPAAPAASAAAPARAEAPKADPPAESSGGSRRGSALGDLLRGAASSGGSRTPR